MGEAAVSIEATEGQSEVQLQLIEGDAQGAKRGSMLTFLVALLIILQILDGTLTALGVSHFGLEAEGNPLLRHFMAQYGFLPALIGAKLVSIVIICLLASFAERVAWIEKAMAGVACLYMAAAIVPWTLILTARLLLA